MLSRRPACRLGELFATEQCRDLLTARRQSNRSVFADHVARNLREGRIVVLVVGDEIRPATDELVTGLQSRANFHLTFALVEVPVYSRPDSLDEFIVTPRTLIETETVPRFTTRTEGGSTDVIGAGTDEREAARPSRRSSISSEDFFEAMGKRSQEIPAKLKQFLDEADAIDVRPDYLGSLNLKWDQPEGSPVNRGCIEPRNGEVWTAASCWKVDPDLAENYNVRTLGRPPPRKSPINTGLAATPGIRPVAGGSARCCLRGGSCRLGRG